jgi:hypothetical protein
MYFSFFFIIDYIVILFHAPLRFKPKYAYIWNYFLFDSFTLGIIQREFAALHHGSFLIATWDRRYDDMLD